MADKEWFAVIDKGEILDIGTEEIMEAAFNQGLGDPETAKIRKVKVEILWNEGDSK